MKFVVMFSKIRNQSLSVNFAQSRQFRCEYVPQPQTAMMGRQRSPIKSFSTASDSLAPRDFSESSRWPRRDWLDDLPPAVLAADSWPIWRRLLLLPDDRAHVRIKAWREISSTARMVSGTSLSTFPGSRKEGIFDESRVHWEHLVGYDGRGTVFNGKRLSQADRIELVTLKGLYGPLVQSTVIDDFQCDIREVEGISASKSSGLHFDSVDAFGRYFNEKKRASVDQEGLDLMLRHQEIRIIHRAGIDSFGISMWDGRLFLGNHGGSHHFAGAAYIAREIQKAVPLAGRLHAHWLNSPAWEWLLERHYVLQVPEKPRYWSGDNAARITGECYTIELPSRFGSGEFVLLPRNSVTSVPLLELLSRHGARELTHDLRALLDQQADVARTIAARWPQVFSGTGYLGQVLASSTGPVTEKALTGC